MSTSTNKLLDRLVKARLVSQKGKAKTYEMILSRKERDRLIDLLVQEDTEAVNRAKSELNRFLVTGRTLEDRVDDVIRRYENI